MSIAWPLPGRITAGFGQRGRHRHHAGVDIDGDTGEEVRAVAAGTVVASGSEGKYGRTVVIDHGSGLTTLYAHASRLLVHEGDRVGQGEAIAEVGASGNAHGSHLHFEVRRNGRPVDPSPYLRSGSVPLPGARGAASAAPSSGSR
jgi:murein DD-endopeptidase MepM/ murein hydrolase activator NlpD